LVAEDVGATTVTAAISTAAATTVAADDSRCRQASASQGG
jgi:hypothetical protein